MKQLASLLIFLLFFQAEAKVSLPSIFSDHMVLQQNSNVKFWGWANANESIKILTSWDQKEYETTTNSFAKWEVSFDTPKAGGPFTITIKGDNEIVLEDILIGEVWLCSGQSNMEWSANLGIDDKQEAVKNANYPNIRLFSVTRKTSDFPKDDVDGAWEVCTPETMEYFSAVGYFFGKNLNENLNIPIGLINSTWGGTYAESWMPNNLFLENQNLANASKKLNQMPWAPGNASIIYNAMIAPLTSLNIAGVIWYQGESNTLNPEDYEEVFTNLIISWRHVFNNDFPFYYAQIAPFSYKDFTGVQVRDVQRRCLTVPNTAMVMTSDIGNLKDIHPRNKKDVGLRFANIALKYHYKTKQGLVEGPLLDKINIEGNKIILSFKHAKGLHATSKESMFEIAGENKVYHVAKYKINGEEIEVFSSQVKQPKYVRFAWDNLAESNLFNVVNLPMSSFISE